VISRLDLEARVREWGLREDVVEKDYVLGWLLWGIGSQPAVADSWAFKGGTCLKKCYLETFRFSEDLDFSVLPGGPYREAELRPVLEELLGRVHEASGIVFDAQPVRLRTHPSGNYTEGRIYYRGPRGAPTVASVRLDLLASEIVTRPTVLRLISHPYPDELPVPGRVRCYGFEELFAEKLRALGERSRPRDLYDVVHLYRRPDLRHHAALVAEVLAEKCANKGVPLPTLASVEASELRDELETEWANMLAHQLPVLPPIESFWDDLPNLFAWLQGEAVESDLEPIESDQQLEEAWRPPAMLWRWGVGAPIEAIRFAAANHLRVELGYQGRRRTIEPYSFRRSKDGNLLLFAVKVESREIRAYRLDRIESVRVTAEPFRPVHQIEIGGEGGIFAPQLRHGRHKVRRAARPRSPSKPPRW
jgi:predicted nucleotidyltransferase component of viral defense system